MSAVEKATAESRTSPLYAFEGRIEPPRASASYQAALLLVAAGMILLPALYAGLVGAAAYGVYYHAVYNLAWLNGGSGGGMRVRLILYAVPLIVGTVTVLFMIKPFFARRAQGPEPLALDRRREPLLFAFMEKLCRTVGAPPPSRIHVNCDVNASAGHLGLASLVNGQLVLTIGLPLVAGMNLRQLSGVLAHELGHFTQGAGMRVSNLIRRVNVWLARVVYERDAWDEMLVEWSQDSDDTSLSFLGHVSRFFVWLSRRVLWVLMMAGHAISGLLMRQMEHDADQYEIRLAGSETFASTALQLRVLSAATQMSYSELSASWREGRLAADLPGFIARRAGEMPEPVMSVIKRSIVEDETGWFDTHPCDRERIERARAERQPGIFKMDAPATVLFRGFEELSRETTLAFYRGVVGDQVSLQNLVGNEVIQGQTAQQDEADRALARYGGGLVELEPPIFLGVSTLPAASSSALAAARQAYDAAWPSAQAVLDKVRKAEQMVRGADLASRLLQANARIDARTFNLPSATLDGAERARRRGQETLEAHRSVVETARGALQARLVAALAEIQDPAIAGNVATDVRALAALEGVFGEVLALRDRVATLATLAGHVESNPNVKELPAQMMAMQPALHGSLLAVRAALSDTPYPFEHATAGISVADFALSAVPDVSDLGGLYDAAQELVGSLYTLQRRLLARLATIAEQVEAAASGLSPRG